MTPERWQQIEAIFQQAIEASPAQRRAYLTQACGNDTTLRHEVESLLAAETAETFFASPIQQAARSLTANPGLIGQRIGVYRVQRLLGRGGMGEVYEAVRDDQQFDQKVALKIVRHEMNVEFVRQRFLSERQILASLKHPHIAHLLDGGTTPSGLSYFVMEYIEGEPITDYCRFHDLSLTEKLRLFQQVCAAVQHAHQKLVVHRDIKPSNILVTKDGTVKLLDFGIAKLIDRTLLPRDAQVTATEMRLMTPDYASPEQVRGQAISTATDIYSLGAVLYELLTDARPHRFTDLTPLEIERVICETEVLKPSELVKQAATARLTRQLAGDLDNIVLMAMRKEPERRYRSVEQFCQDIQRYLDGLPVTARQDTLGYRTGKFLRRNKWKVTATALIALSLLGGLAATTYQQRRAERRFQQVRKLANTFLFEFHDKIANLPGSTEARETVAKTGLEYLDSLAQEAKGDPSLQIELAEGYLRLARVQGGYRVSGLEQFEAALASFRKALALGQELMAREPKNTRVLTLLIECYAKLADFQRGRGDTAGAPATMREALRLVELLEAQPNLKQEELLSIITLLHLNGDLELEQGNRQAALQNYRRALQFDERLSAQFPGRRAQHSMSLDLATLGDARAAQGDLKGAMEEYDKALELRLENVRQNPNNATYRRELALLYLWMGHYSGSPLHLNLGDRKKAEQYYRQCLAIAGELASADPKNIQGQMDLSFGYEHVANMLTATDPAQAIELYRKALAILRPLLEKAPDELRYLRRQAIQQRLLAVAWQKHGEPGSALSQMREALAQGRKLVARHAGNAMLKADLCATLLANAELLVETGARQEAAQQFHEALALAEEMTKARPHDLYWRWRLADAYAGLGQYQGALGSEQRLSVTQRLAAWREARTWQQKALAVWEAWSQHATSSVFNVSRREQAARAIAQCDAALAQLSGR